MSILILVFAGLSILLNVVVLTILCCALRRSAVESTDKHYVELCIKDRAELTDQEFTKCIKRLLLGKDWYVIDPVNGKQANLIALKEILEKYGN